MSCCIRCSAERSAELTNALLCRLMKKTPTRTGFRKRCHHARAVPMPRRPTKARRPSGLAKVTARRRWTLVGLLSPCMLRQWWVRSGRSWCCRGGRLWSRETMYTCARVAVTLYSTSIIGNLNPLHQPVLPLTEAECSPLSRKKSQAACASTRAVPFTCCARCPLLSLFTTTPLTPHRL